MQRGSTDQAGLSAVIARQRTHVRMLLEQDDGRWLMKRLVADFAPMARSIPSRSWDYGTVKLLSGSSSGTRVMKWLSTRTGDFLGCEFEVLEWYPQVQWEEQPSNSPMTTSPLPWPFTQYRVTPSGTGQPLIPLTHQGLLIGRGDAPSFPSVEIGAYEFLYGPYRQGRSLPTDFVMRVARPDVWIHHVRMSPTQMAVQLRGRRAVGARVELTASLRDHGLGIAGPNRKVTIDLPRGLPSGAVLLASVDGTWRDHRHLDPVYRLESGDFSWESGDRSTELEALISTGEAAQLEFKREIPTVESSKQTLLKTIAAFANGDGGEILFGVENDGVITGVADAARQADRLSNLIKDTVYPAPAYDVARVRIDNRDVLALTIQPGPDVPYALRRGRTLTYHVRRAGTTFLAEPHELRAVVLARQPQPQTYPAGLLRP